ncbi:MAG: hypothetical protein OXE77_11425 [Flavobacteriaceae bacterium]|nr:hypothetical protein [Flavobacteriaceae bacterium]MCY4266610.1 hypothetical protein [Flavobacteriaceae bacterium]
MPTTSATPPQFESLHHPTSAGLGGEITSSQRVESDQALSITALFEKIPYPIAVTATGGGSISGITSEGHPQGSVVIFMAVPEENHLFSQWWVDASCDCPDLNDRSHPRVAFVVEDSCALKAVFLKAPRTITSVSEGGHITPSITVEHGEEVRIMVTVASSYVFQGWASDCGDFSRRDVMIRFHATQDCQVVALLKAVEDPIPTTNPSNQEFPWHPNSHG